MEITFPTNIFDSPTRELLVGAKFSKNDHRLFANLFSEPNQRCEIFQITPEALRTKKKLSPLSVGFDELYDIEGEFAILTPSGVCIGASTARTFSSMQRKRSLSASDIPDAVPTVKKVKRSLSIDMDEDEMIYHPVTMPRRRSVFNFDEFKLNIAGFDPALKFWEDESDWEYSGWTKEPVHLKRRGELTHEKQYEAITSILNNPDKLPRDLKNLLNNWMKSNPDLNSEWMDQEDFKKIYLNDEIDETETIETTKFKSLLAFSWPNNPYIIKSKPQILIRRYKYRSHKRLTSQSKYMWQVKINPMWIKVIRSIRLL